MAVLEAVAGIMESRIYGFTDRAKPAQGFALLRRTTRQLVNETTSGAVATRSLVVL